MEMDFDIGVVCELKHSTALYMCVCLYVWNEKAFYKPGMKMLI